LKFTHCHFILLSTEIVSSKYISRRTKTFVGSSKLCHSCLTFISLCLCLSLLLLFVPHFLKLFSVCVCASLFVTIYVLPVLSFFLLCLIISFFCLCFTLLHLFVSFLFMLLSILSVFLFLLLLKGSFLSDFSFLSISSFKSNFCHDTHLSEQERVLLGWKVGGERKKRKNYEI